jgi:hypothetical protein
VNVNPVPGTTPIEHLPGERPCVRAACDVGPELDILERSELGEEVERLKDEADAPAAEREQLPTRRPSDVPARHHDAPFGRRIERADDIQQRRLAASRRTQLNREILGRDPDRDVCERDHDVRASRVTLTDRGQLDQRIRTIVR